MKRAGTPQPQALAEQLHRDLQAIRAVLRRPLEAEIARGNLTGPQQSAMAALVRSGPMSLKELCAQLGLAHSTTSGIVDRLEKRGMVRREMNATDRRLTRLAVTPEVETWMKRNMPQLGVTPLLRALRRATPAERDRIVAGVKTLRALLDKSSA